MLGSLILHNRSADMDVLPLFEQGKYETGSHTPGRTNGVWFFQSDLRSQQIYIPQRDKRITAYHSKDLSDLEDAVKSIDALPGHRFLDKLVELKSCLPISSTLVLNTQGDHGTWSILSDQVHYYVVRSAKSTQLVWSTQDIIPPLRKQNVNGYMFYRLAPMGACFLNTQALCSRYWRWISAKEVDMLKVMNALEVFLDGKVR